MYKVYKKTPQEVWVMNETSKELTRLKRIKSHSELGNFYVFNSVLSMPYQRKVMFDLIQQFNSLGIDKEELIKENNEILTLLESREQGFEMKIYSKITEINKTAKSLWDYQRSSMLIAALLVVHEDDLDLIGIFDQQQAEKRINEWSKDSELLAFFLNIAQMKCNNLINKLEVNLPNFLETEFPSIQPPLTSKEEKWFLRLIGKIKNLLN
ncbi:hypothetical protein D1631_17005 [Chryseobacterium nematophagum]|uniref:Uncharacterized protein n=1 Tax=Chryseobacterium nematophagum TaxID=2305228 RepID=A0A3M7TKF0_9FLAO|nr:hypothetical protein [Chryseobacterium nematophagum]RNA63496.1 hypothetical protein D1631_17005 [Chryseobacterium nematophagum]